jgi:hypothetical protein
MRGAPAGTQGEASPCGVGCARAAAASGPGEGRGAEVVADAALVRKELSGHHRANHVAALVVWRGATAPISVEPCDRVGATWLQPPPSTLRSPIPAVSAAEGALQELRRVPAHGYSGGSGCLGPRRLLAADTSLWTDDVWVADSTPVECGRSRETARRSYLAGVGAVHSEASRPVGARAWTCWQAAGRMPWFAGHYLIFPGTGHHDLRQRGQRAGRAPQLGKPPLSFLLRGDAPSRQNGRRGLPTSTHGGHHDHFSASQAAGHWP